MNNEPLAKIERRLTALIVAWAVGGLCICITLSALLVWAVTR